MVLEWLRHQLSDAASDVLARSALFFGELEANLTARPRSGHIAVEVSAVGGFNLRGAQRDAECSVISVLDIVLRESGPCLTN